MSTISIEMAAQISGKSQATIRRWAGNNIIPAKKTEDGRWIFDKEELINYLKAHGKEMIDAKIIKQKPTNENNHSLISAYEQQIKILTTTLERERCINDELRSEMYKITEEIKTLLSKEPRTTSPSRWIKTKVQNAFGI
jgi:DNA-binding transcriptional MerR regulator